jgi:tRNA dimethylallyltransferase
MKYKKLIVIGGATASGKTALAIKLAQQLNTEIISADSRQFYRQMTIGTAKPSPEELAAAPHHFIDNLDISEEYSVGDFEREAMVVLENIFQKNDCAILVGGSGLFLKAIYEGLDEFPEISETTKMKVAALESIGLSAMQKTLQEIDYKHFTKMDHQNPARLRRALELCLETGKPYLETIQKTKQPRNFQTQFLLLDPSRPQLYARINERVDKMVTAGLEEEARGLLPFRHKNALKTVGYEEWFDFFDGKMTHAETIDKIKQHTRNYAKRQGTWFRKYGDWEVVNT